MTITERRFLRVRKLWGEDLRITGPRIFDEKKSKMRILFEKESKINSKNFTIMLSEKRENAKKTLFRLKLKGKRHAKKSLRTIVLKASNIRGQYFREEKGL